MKIISNIGGFSSFNFLIFGIISSYILPKIFSHKVSNHFYKKINEQKEKSELEFYQAQNIQEVKSYLKNIFSFERFVQLNVSVDEL
jgi:hypothetical protein